MGRGLRMSVCRLPQCGRARSIERAISVRSGKHLRMAIRRLRFEHTHSRERKVSYGPPDNSGAGATEHRRSYEVAVAAFSAVPKV